ncbi:MAG: hypothetical protein R2734_03870 [Nocardioides sp.]
MPVKRMFKGPWPWIALVVVAVVLGLQLTGSPGGYDEIPTSEMNKYIADGSVKEITFVDGDQEVRATLDADVKREGGDRVSTHWIYGQQEGMIQAVDEQIKAGTIESENSENPQPSLLGSFLVTVLPFCC